MREILETERLTLREITKADLPILFGIFGDVQSMGFYPRAKSFEETEAWFEKLAFRSYKEQGFGLWGIVERATGELIGDCGLTLQQTPRGLEPEIGYHLRREWLGRGYAAEAAAACRDFGLASLGFERIVSIVSPENVPSLRVAARIHQRWEKYRTVTAAGAEVDRFLFISERDVGEAADHVPSAEARVALVEGDALLLMRRRETES
ncbi:GNAT family N-acetyltransferase [Neorhizobium galegae]|uniref:GNAT family N-acetyltransferase n=1 Tax=Neorhizobium galegae TaxID=399 RepID=UPI000620F116|nr:GNAT family N-acetyltransferase [Neorhizobium galegae]KAA9388099.1 GNAT family N-acetyltransferase [Neorhizobium galegae]KAB1115440.1 GNAT family N-acetyltransferase [Neorhizobium galegae]CDZ28321.1 Acetyltransferase, ribosomal protein N-acetylase [Neorhizobium galegae bv. officinalis]